MPALSDPKLEAFSQALLRNFAKLMPRTKAMDEAGREAGYPIGKNVKTFSANCRKRAQRKDVKARLVELAAPAQAAVEAEISVDIAKAKSRLSEIIMAGVNLDETVMPKDVINAVRQLAAIEGWNAPTTVNVNKHVSTDWSTDELVAFVTDAAARLERGEAQDCGKGEPDRIH